MIWRLCRKLLWALVVGAMLPDASHADKLALLVGVSSYPGLPADKQLRGPRNDVPLMRELLQRRGFRADRIVVLADGVPGAGDPTRQRILDAAGQLAEAARPGDSVVLYFAGHGAQVASDDTVPAGYRRPYGRQQVFLPRDVSKLPATASQTRVPQAIADHELTRVVERIRARGAMVWAIFDACFSGTFVRGEEVADTEQARQLSPQDLGLPELPSMPLLSPSVAPDDVVLIDRSEQPVRGAATDSGPALAGGYVAFYAAQQHESTNEEAWQEGGPQPVTRGLFTHWLAQALASAPEGSTYRQLGTAIRSAYLKAERRIPTPLFTGTLLDQPLFGQAAAPAPRAWPVRMQSGALRVQAGALDGVSVGSILTVLSGSLSAKESVLGEVRVVDAELLASTVAWVDPAGPLPRGSQALPPESVARLKQSALDFPLRVAAEAEPSGRAAPLVDAVRKRLGTTLPVVWSPASSAADVRLTFRHGRAWLLSPGERLVRDGPHPSWGVDMADPQADARLAEQLQRTAKALKLLQLADTHRPTDPQQAGLQVQVERRRGDQRSPLSADAPSPVRDRDQLVVEVRNLDPLVAVDLTALYLDSRRQLQALFPHGASGRIPAAQQATGAARQTFSFRANARTVGLEHLVLILVRAQSGGEPHDFSHLQDAQPPASRGEGEGQGESDDITAWLNDAVFGPSGASRGAPEARRPVPRGTVQIVSYPLWIQSDAEEKTP